MLVDPRHSAVITAYAGLDVLNELGLQQPATWYESAAKV